MLSLFAGTTTALPAFGAGKFAQLFLAATAVNTLHNLGAVPKTAASLANFQLHAQFHDELSTLGSAAGNLSEDPGTAGEQRTRQANSNFF